MIEVRRAAPADASAIVRLALEVQAFHVAARPDLFKPGGSETVPEILERIGSGDHLYWVAALDGAVVGYAYARLSEEPDSRWKWRARTLTLDQMGVAAQHQRQGLGQRLVEVVCRAAEDCGADRVILNVWAFNVQAQRFYERMGFTPFHQRMALELARRNGEGRQ